MFGLVTKKKHNYIVNGLEGTILRLRESLETYKVFNKNQRKKMESQAKQIIEQTEKIVELERRLSGAVEGLSVHDVEVMRARANGGYIYTVYRSDGAVAVVYVPMSSKHPDYEAKKIAGFTKSNMVGVKAERWTLDNIK